MTAVLLLVAALLVLLALVAAQVAFDLTWEHPGATEGWSPIAEVGPSVSTIDFAAGTGWPA